MAAPKTEKRGATAWSSVTTLMNAAVGAGVLSIPYAFSCLGAGLGPVIALSIVCLEVYTLCVLVKAGERMGCGSYQELVLAAFGPKASVFVSCALVVYLVGSCAAYLIIVGDTIQPMMGPILPSSMQFLANRQAVIAVIACCFVLPLSLLRTLDSFSFFSSLAPFCLLYTTVCIIFRAKDLDLSDGLPEGARYVSKGWDFINGFPIILFAFQCHIQVNQVYTELEEKPTFQFWKKRLATWPMATHAAGNPLQAGEGAPAEEPLLVAGSEVADEPWLAGDTEEYVRRTRRQRIMYCTCLLALLTCCCFYTLVGSFGYLQAPLSKETNVMNNYSDGDHMMNGARCAMCLVAMVSYPINHFSARSAIDDLITSYMGWPKSPPKGGPLARHVALTLGFFGTTLAIGLNVDNLGVVFELIGATVGSLVVLIFPALLTWPGAIPLQFCTTSIQGELSLEGQGIVSRERSLFGTHWIYKVSASCLISLGVLVALFTVLLKCDSRLQTAQ